MKEIPNTLMESTGPNRDGLEVAGRGGVDDYEQLKISDLMK